VFIKLLHVSQEDRIKKNRSKRTRRGNEETITLTEQEDKVSVCKLVGCSAVVFNSMSCLFLESKQRFPVSAQLSLSKLTLYQKCRFDASTATEPFLSYFSSSRQTRASFIWDVQFTWRVVVSGIDLVFLVLLLSPIFFVHHLDWEKRDTRMTLLESYTPCLSCFVGKRVQHLAALTDCPIHHRLDNENNILHLLFSINFTRQPLFLFAWHSRWQRLQSFIINFFGREQDLLAITC